MKTQIVKSIALVCGLSLASIAAPSIAGVFDHGGSFKMMKRMAHKLDLSDEQRQEMKSILTEAKESRQAIKTEMQSYRAQVKSLVEADEFNENAFIALNKEFESTFQAMALAKAKTRHAMHKVMTDEQREKLVEMKEKRKERKEKRKSRHSSY